MNFTVLNYWDIALAALLLFINAGLSLAFRLGLGKRLLIAGSRMMVQLTMVGLVLKALFAMVSPLFTGLAVLVMVLFAGREATDKVESLMLERIGGGLSVLLATHDGAQAARLASRRYAIEKGVLRVVHPPGAGGGP